jgi:phage terminase large subunit-like protein
MTRLKDLQILEATLKKANHAKRLAKLKDYDPYPKQREFHTMGAFKKERLLMAGNRQGKTYCGAMEMTYHLTGQYPDWWEGRVWTRPIHAWAGGVTATATRDIVQAMLLGATPYPEFKGQGSIPLDCIGRHSPTRGVADAVDTIMIKHISGGWSTLQFKSYEQGREKWQGADVDFVWFDEEPDYHVYTEGKTRTNGNDGIIIMTFTPLLGMSSVVKRFLDSDAEDENGDKVDRRTLGKVNMTIEDALHFTPQMIQDAIDGYEEWEIDARIKGLPMLGEGRVFTAPEEFITCEPFEIPLYWPILAGLDIGIAHPTAAAKIAWDRDTDTIYVCDEHRRSNILIPEHAAAIRAWHPDIPVAWPHDGHSRDKGSGLTIAKQYQAQQCKMMPMHAQFTGEEGGGNSVEAGIMEMIERMKSGRFKVFRTCTRFFGEYRLFHRKDGELVKVDDDLISAVRYGMMMRRYGKPMRDLTNHRPKTGSRVVTGVDFDL